VVDTRDLTEPSQSGWALDYRIRRQDGEELHARFVGNLRRRVSYERTPE
jgi:hypothetical protein